jgi:protein phosphatase
VGAASSCGRRHPHNTDHFLALRLGRLQETLLTSLHTADLPSRFEEYGYALLVADGFGDDDTGARASRVALSTLAHMAVRYGKWNVRVDPETPSEIIEQGEFFFRRAHDALFRESRTDPRLAGLTAGLTALYLAEDDLFFARVGSSSAFLFRNGVLIQLTLDHPPVEPGRPTRLERPARTFGRRAATVIGRGSRAPDLEIEHIKLSPADRLLLCTDGLTDVVTEDQIADALAGRRRPREDCLRLIDLAREAGGTDDVTVLLGDYRLQRIRPDDRHAHLGSEQGHGR